MKWSLNLGRIAGIRVSIHWTFAILIGWIVFAQIRAGATTAETLLMLGFVLTIFLCVVLHEFGHALTARRFDIKTRSITLLPIGGLAQMEEMPEKPIQELWVAIAGPLVNVVIAGLLFAWLKLTNGIPDNPETIQKITTENFLFALFFSNGILAVFNLIPAFPMDGGRVFRALLAMKFDRVKATRIAAGLGQILAIGFAFFGLFNNPILVFIAIFIFLGAQAEASHVETKSILSGKTVGDVLMHQITVLKGTDLLSEAVKQLLDGQDTGFLVKEDGKIAGILTRNDLISGLSKLGENGEIRQAMNADFITLSPETPLDEAYTSMQSKGFSLLPVMKDSELSGVLDLENIREVIMVREALSKKI